MPADESVREFPRDAYLKLLQDAQRLFASEQDRRNLLAGLGMSAGIAQRQKSSAVLPPPPTEQRTVGQPEGPGGATASDRSGRLVSVSEKPTDYDAERLSSPARFAVELVELVSHPSSLDAAITLARRAVAELRPEAAPHWQELLQHLAALQRKYRIEGGPSPDLAGYREWIGFECRHPYSLTDRFVGRGKSLKELDNWVVNDTDITIRCILALGGGGKSALAWYWLSQSLPLIRRSKYQGAFWCSFYEKNFNFDEFIRRALIFAGQLNESEVRSTPRPAAEDRLLDILQQRRLVIVLDGLERLMNGYAVVASRAVDLESLAGSMGQSGLTRTDRRMVDPRDGAFLRRLARSQPTRILITTRLVPADLESSKDTALAHVAFTELGGLAESEAIDLWVSLLPSAKITKKVRAVLLICGYHPLVISVLARAIAKSGGSFDEWLSLETHRDFKPKDATSEAAVRSHIVGICLRDLPEASYDVLGVLTATGKPMRLKELAVVLLLGSVVSGDGRWAHESQVREHLQELIDLGLVGKAEPVDQDAEYDVHPVVRGAAWNLLTDPNRERFLDHALSEFAATPDRRGPGELDDLNKAMGLYRLLVQTGQLDRAWEMFIGRLWAPLCRHNANRQLLNLFGLFLPDREVLRLLPLTSRRAQGDAAGVLGDLLARVGEGIQAKTLLRWCGTIRLQIGDLSGFLDASHVRAWQTLYEGELFETESSLRRLKVQALACGAQELMPILECWIGIVLALRGERERARKCFEIARGRTRSNNWWVQGLAEGLVYLDEASQALEVLALLESDSSGEEAGSPQVSWEKLTEGMAYMGTGNYEKAKEALSLAYKNARQTNYAIVQCFALPALAEIALTSSVSEAEDWVNSYFEVDPHSSYALSAADAWRIRSRCQLASGDAKSALECAQRAFRLAACDGPPFVYKAGIRRALETLKELGAYVPVTDARLDPQWREYLSALEEEERNVERAVVDEEAEQGDGEELSFAEAIAALGTEAAMPDVPGSDREWWDQVTGSHSEIRVLLMEDLKRSQISPASFRKAFDDSPHKSLTAVFNQLRAERLIYPKRPHPVRELNPTELADWVSDANAHQKALDTFLHSAFALRVTQPFLVHHFDAVDSAVFLNDYKRRIEFDAEPTAQTWWEQLEKARPAMDMLVLAECVLVMPAKLAEVVAEISVGSGQGITYAFYALLTRRAIDRFESKAMSKSEGWSDIDVLLKLQDVKLQIRWADASAEARQFWEKLEWDNTHHLRQVLQLAEELRRRDASVDDYYEAYLLSNSGNIQANLAYLDYLRHRREPWDPTVPWSTDAVAERWVYESIRPRFTETEKLSSDQIAGRLEILLDRVGRKDLDQDQRAWWGAVELRSNPAMLLRMAEELDVRRETLAAMRKAEVDGGTENLIALLAYLDFTVLKRGEDYRAKERASEHNRAGNAHYENAEFHEAAACYEEAIKERPAAVYFSNLAGAWERVTDIDPTAALDQAVAALRRGLEAFHDSDELRKALSVVETKKRLAERGGFVRYAKSHQMLPVVTPIAMEVAADLIPLVERAAHERATTLIERIPEILDRIKDDTGVKLPPVRFRGNEKDMPPGSYLIMLEEIPIVMGTVSLGKGLTMASAATLSELEIPFEKGVNPVDGSDAFWIALEHAGRLTEATWDASEYMLRHLEAVLRSNLSLFAGMQEVILRLEESWSPAARRIASDQSLIERFTRMTKALLDERVPMTHIEPISDVYLNGPGVGTAMDELLNRIRSLPEIRPKLPGNRPGSTLFEFDAEIERELVEALVPLGDEFVLALTPEHTQDVLGAVRRCVAPRTGPQEQAVVVRDRLIRRYVRKLVELEFPQLFALCNSELTGDEKGTTRTTISFR